VKYIILVLIATLFVSCGGIKSVSSSSLTNKNGIFYHAKDKKAYTGVAVTTYDNKKKKEKRFYKKGELYKVLTWNEKGKKTIPKDLWVYQYGTYIQDNNYLFLASGRSEKSEMNEMNDVAMRNAEKKISFLLKYYSKVLVKIYKKSVRKKLLTEKEFKDGISAILEKNIFPNKKVDGDKESYTLVLPNIQTKTAEDRVYNYVGIELSLKNLNLEIKKLSISDKFKSLLEKNSVRAFNVVKKRWYNYLKKIEEKKNAYKQKYKEYTDKNSIKNYSLKFYDNGEKKKFTYSYKKGIKVITWYRNKKKKSEMFYLNKKLNGLYLYWNKDGRKIEESHYKDGKLDGKSVKWDNNGKKIIEFNYEKGNLKGKQFKWYSNGNKKEESLYTDAKLDGTRILYYDTEQKKEEATFLAGKLEGFLFRFHKNGTSKEEYFNTGGKIEGEYKAFYDNKQKKEIGNYAGGLKEGVFKKWHKNGKRAEKVRYKNGLKVGYFTAWYDNGKKAEQGKYKNGKKEGRFTYWNENGKKVKVVTFKNDEEIKTKTY